MWEVNFIVEPGQDLIPPLAFSFIPGYDVTLPICNSSEPSSKQEETGEKTTEPAHKCDPSDNARVNLTIGPPAINFVAAGAGGTGYLRCVFKLNTPNRLTYWNWRIHGTSAWFPNAPTMPAPKVNDAKVAQAASGSGIDYNLKFIPTVSGDTAPTIFTVRVYANYTTMVTIEYQ